MPKNVKRYSKAKKETAPQYLLIAGGLVLVVFAVLFAVFGRSKSNYQAEVTGGPSLKVDQEKIDFGDVKLGKTVEAKFTVTNIGDQPLKFIDVPTVRVEEGC